MAYKYIPFFGGQTKLLINKNAEEFNNLFSVAVNGKV
jgi:hypothetical protein